ncbi:hypothetical protein D770_08215 [Flammeovirgaceae bacterium 311]|nr:hypothetical protein D770_08215 [Flammeovirgaceae bacterium 311]
MKLIGKNILIISPEAWGEYFVSKHHYATELAAQGNYVYFLNPPSKGYTIESTKFDNLSILNYPGFPKGMRYYPNFLQKHFIANRYQKLEHLSCKHFDIVWSFDTSVFYDFSALPASVIKILHIVDLNQDFQTESAAKTADICLCTTELIKAKLLPFNINTHKIHHGVRLNEFGNGIDRQIKLPGNNLIKALYVGNLSMQFLDWEKLLTVIRSHANIDFLFLGPEGRSNLSTSIITSSAKDEIKSLPNTYFMPPVPADLIMYYLLAADLLLVSYKEDNYDDQASPHKIMEYLASGKPVVATWTEEYADKDLLYMSKSMEDFLKIFSWVIDNIGSASSELSAAKRKAFAADNTYTEQIRKIQELIQIRNEK